MQVVIIMGQRLSGKLMKLLQQYFTRRRQSVAKHYWRSLCAAVLLVLFIGAVSPALSTLAKAPAGESQERITYEWFLLQWSNRQVVCTVMISHEGVPTSTEIQARCNDWVYDTWLTTTTCAGAYNGGDTTDCEGLYLVLNDVMSWSPVDAAPLNTVRFEAALGGCIPSAPNNWCANIPILIVRSDTDVDQNPVVRIDYKIGPDIFSCLGNSCEIPLKITSKRGELIQFWGVDITGAAGFAHEVRYRLLDTGSVEIVSDDEGYIIDIVGSALQQNEGSCCSAAWATFRPIKIPLWLSTPTEAAYLKTNERYYYLAGRMIKNGLVDPGACPNGGLGEAGYASECGLSLAMQDIMAWQNQYDELIMQASTETGVPAQLLKNLFARESQMWPADYGKYEYGLGHITEPGTDTLLMWNYEFFMKFCTLQFGFSKECSNSYTKLSVEDQHLLMGLVINFSTAYCSDCPYTIDQAAVPFAVELFAETLKANAYQTGQIIRNVTGKDPGEVTSYEDLWRFTLVNYTAGPGCLAEAVETTYINYGRQLNWSNLQWGLSETCDESIDYVNDITGDLLDTP